jgi:hypothetical protein
LRPGSNWDLSPQWREKKKWRVVVSIPININSLRLANILSWNMSLVVSELLLTGIASSEIVCTNTIFPLIRWDDGDAAAHTGIISLFSSSLRYWSNMSQKVYCLLLWYRENVW